MQGRSRGVAALLAAVLAVPATADGAPADPSTAAIVPGATPDAGEGSTGPAAAPAPAPAPTSFAAAPWRTRHRPRKNLGELGLGLGVLLPSRDHELYDYRLDWLRYDPVAAALALRGGFYPLGALGLEAAGALAPARCECGGRALIYGLRGHLVVQLPLASVVPFALVGGGVLGTTGAFGRDLDPSLHFGGGLKIHLTRHLGLRLDARAHLGLAHTREAYRTFHPELLAGLIVTLGRPYLDTDRDGLPDPGQRAVREDACPLDPGPRSMRGCPDADRDGVRDADDRCPTDPGLRERDGCPELRDGDGDGFWDPDQYKISSDRADACPDQAGVEPYAGCPVPDRDGDGLDDLRDGCPDQPEAINGFDDLDGCPDDLPLDVAGILGKVRGIQFGFLSDRLTEASNPILERAAAILAAYAGLELEIQGHTDADGDPAFNKQLSQRRAEAVRRALVGYGVAEDRLHAVGYGGDRPIADNGTEDGRAKNRRIEFRLLDAQGQPLPVP